MSFRLGKRSLRNLEGVDPDLSSVVRRAIEITTIDFTVLEGVRTLDRQKELVKKGASKTLNSRHISGHAVDVAPWVDGAIPWNDHGAFESVALAMFQAADELGVLVQWGGDWDFDGDSADESFLDMPHFQEPWPHRLEKAKEAARMRVKARRVTGTVRGFGDMTTDELKTEIDALAEMSRQFEARLKALSDRAGE